jgi:predicted nucleotidyltransferase
MSDDRVERVARAMSKADGKDPDRQEPTGRMETVRLSANSVEQREATIKAWRAYEKEARRFIAALDAGRTDMRDEWLHGLRSWANENGSVRELWLFGSRATGCSRPESDVDIAIALMPPTDGTNWALGNYERLGDEWQQQLEAIVGRHVSLEAILPGTPEDEWVRRCGAHLWTREASDT